MVVHDMSHEESVDIAASPQKVWDTVRDLGRMGEWSPENQGGTWLSGDGTSVGDQFEGVNTIGDRTWKAVAEVTRTDPGEAFCFSVGGIEDPVTKWGYLCEPNEDGGTRLTEVWEVGRLPPTMVDSPPEQIAMRREMVIEAIRTTLGNIKATIES